MRTGRRAMSRAPVFAPGPIANVAPAVATRGSGGNLDAPAPLALGGWAPSRIAQPLRGIKLPIPADWHLAVVTPHVRGETKAARAILPMEWARGEWITQMANVAAMVHAFATGDGALLRRALDDRYA